MNQSHPRSGLAAAAIAYFVWGLFPLYWSLLGSISTFQVLAHRAAWCAAAVWIYLLATGDRGWWRGLGARSAGTLVISGMLISVNWGVYVFGVTSGHVLDTSLGYFITPLANVLFGVAVLRERMNPTQWAAVACALAGVTYLAVSIGALPWIALVLSLSFGCYGLLRKLTPVDPVHGLAFESSVMMVPSVLYLLWCQWHGTAAFGHEAMPLDLLLVAGGPVTAIPLVLFSYAARRVPMTVMGFLQYLSPTVGLILGVFLYHEPFGQVQMIAFGCIWLALGLFSIDAMRRYLRRAGGP